MIDCQCNNPAYDTNHYKWNADVYKCANCGGDLSGLRVIQEKIPEAKLKKVNGNNEAYARHRSFF